VRKERVVQKLNNNRRWGETLMICIGEGREGERFCSFSLRGRGEGRVSTKKKARKEGGALGMQGKM